MPTFSTPDPHDHLVPCRQHGDPSGWCYQDSQTGQHFNMASCVCGDAVLYANEHCPVPSHKRRAQQKRLIGEALQRK